MTIPNVDCKWCLYYKSGIVLVLALARVINYALRVILQIVASLTEDSRGIIYVSSIFILETTDVVKLPCLKNYLQKLWEYHPNISSTRVKVVVNVLLNIFTIVNPGPKVIKLFAALIYKFLL